MIRYIQSLITSQANWLLMQRFQPVRSGKLGQALEVLSIIVCEGSVCRTEVGHCDWAGVTGVTGLDQRMDPIPEYIIADKHHTGK